MNTTIRFVVVQKNESTVAIQEAIDAGFDEFDRIVEKFTRFADTSELSNLNRQAGRPVQVSQEFFDLISFMLSIARKTNGAFDPTVIDFLEVYGYDKNYDFSRLDNPEVLQKFVQKRIDSRPSWEAIITDAKTRTVTLAKNQRIDLGGVGKGYAIDCAWNVLRKVAENFLIDAGGDIRVSGKNHNEKSWSIYLRSSRDVDKMHLSDFLELKSGEALASSGSWARKVKQFHHLINTQTGEPVKTDYETVCIRASTALEADAWATAVFVGGDSIYKKAKNDGLWCRRY